MVTRKGPTTTLARAAALAAASILPGLVPGALAQSETEIKAADYLVTNANDSAIRSGADLAWYVVAQLDKGTVLKLGSEVDNWFRVEYPVGTPAVVKSVDAELHQDKGIVVLTRRSSLLAYNLFNPYMEDCYKRLFAEQPLPPGTELKYIGPMENRRGEMTGYKVVAPAGAEGYILPANVRPATPEEVSTFMGAPAPKVAAAPAESAKTSTAPVESKAAPHPTPAVATPATTTKPVVERPEPASKPASKAAAGDEMEMGEPAPRPASRAWNGAPRRLEDVDAAYKKVMKENVETAEFGQLIAEYSAILGSLPAGQDAELERAYIQDRIELLKIRAQIQQDVRRLAALEAQAANAQQNLDEFVKSVQAARGYLVVGKLSPSIIYDGKRLPRMFRVVSVDAATGGRTLAYVLPNPDLNMVGKLGSLVGVQGADDPTARRGEVRVIKPTAVDVLTTDTGTPEAPSPAPATAVSDGSDSSGT